MTSDEKWDELKRTLLEKEAKAHERANMIPEEKYQRRRSAHIVAGNTFGRVLVIMAKLDEVP